MRVPQPRGRWRYEPSDETLEAFERLEGWLRGTNGRPVDAHAEETLRVLALALLQGNRGWLHAAQDRLEAMRFEVPPYVAVADVTAFGETLGGQFDCLRESARAAAPCRDATRREK